MNLKDQIKVVVAALDNRARPWARRSRWNSYAYEFLLFGLKQAWACLFGGLMLALLVGTHLFWPTDALLARYDFLVIAAVTIQALLLALKLERWDEARVIFIFHIVGTVMELFKVAHGSWIYPEPSLLRIGGVPLFTGFMYACVGSYIARIWRLFDMTFERYPPLWSTYILVALIYTNFFTHHYIIDLRIGLFALSALLFGRTWVVFTPDQMARRMPLLAGMVLVSLFIWFAENLGTFAGAWIYPNQNNGWHWVSVEKIGAWYLLMMISFMLVTLVNRPVDACAARIRKEIQAAT